MTITPDITFVASLYNPDAYKVLGAGVDAHGNLWCCLDQAIASPIRCIDQTGAELSIVTNTDVQLEICDFILANQAPATSWTAVAGSHNHPGVAGVVSDGTNTYLAYYWRATQVGDAPYYDTLAIYSTAADGSRTLLGAAWTESGDDAFNFLAQGRAIDLCGAKTFNDPTIVWVENNLNLKVSGRIFPSVASIAGGLCSAFIGRVYRFSDGAPHTTYFNLGSQTPLKFGVNASALSPPVFVMPYGAGTTRLHSYWGASSMAANHAAYLASSWNFACMWVEENAYPTYPNGCMIVSDLGVVAAPALTASTPTVNFTTITPSVAPGVLDGAPAFTSVRTYYDGTGSNVATNDYFAAPSTLRRSAGLYETAWYYPYFTNNTYIVSTDWTFLGSMRLMSYDPSTGAFTTTIDIRGEFAEVEAIDPAGSGGGSPFDYIDIVGFAAFWDGSVLKLWNTDGTSGQGSAPVFAWLVSLGTESVVDVGSVILLDCARILVTGLTAEGVYSGTVLDPPLPDVLLDDPGHEPFPFPYGRWSVASPVTEVTGLGHLEGKEVWALADGLVEGPFTVETGAITLPFAASVVVVGLKYTGQVKTLYLTAEGINQGTEQGKRKMLPAVTLRVDCTRGLKVGGSFDRLTVVPELVLAGSRDLFTGDAYSAIFVDWNTKGEICIQQDEPLPANILGVIPAVVAGDTGR